MKLFFYTLSALLATALPTVAQTTVPLTDRSLVKLLPDPVRPKVYGLNQGNGTLPGTLLAFDSTNGQPRGEIPVGLSPTDMAITGTGEALFVINTGSRTLMKVDLTTFAVTATRSFSTPNTYDPANPLHVAAGRSNVVYFTDGGWSPGVYTFNFASGAVLGEFDDDNGVGGLAVTRDGATMYTWRQYGWGAGNVNSWVSRLDARNANLLPLETSFISWRRDPFDTPVLLNASETLVFNKQQMFAATNVAILLGEFPENIYAISRRGDLVFGNSKVYSSATGYLLTNLPLASTVQALSPDDQNLFLYRSNPSELILQPLALLVGAGWDTNQPPVARYVRTPTNATTLTTITFDGTSSTDDQGVAGLEFRWDWESDGTYDTAFTNTPMATHRYGNAGTKSTTLQVKDRYGAIATVAQSFDVIQEDDPGAPGGGNPMFEVQFPAADIAFDPVRPYAYVSGYNNKSLAMLNLTNGLIERQFTFAWNAESIAISPNGERMYLALLTRPHDYYWWNEDGHIGYIAEFNLVTRVKIREFQINEDPYDLSVTDSGILVVPGGSGQWTYIRSYQAPTGQSLGSAGIRQMSRIALHPSQVAVYTADTDSSPSDIRRYDFDPVTGALLSSWDSPYHGDYPMSGKVWCHPNGTNVLVRGGGVYSSSPSQAQDMRYLRTLSGGVIDEVAFDTAHNALFTVGNGSLSYYNLGTLELATSQSMSNGVRYVHADSRYVYVAWTAGSSTFFQRFPNPSVGAETNQPPEASFVRTPVNATTLTTITFDGTASTDDQGQAALEYRWDWENDGAFDTAFTNRPVATHQYNIAGTKTVTLQVRDRYGSLGTVSQTFDVIHENDPGQPGGSNPAFEVQFVAADVEFDPVRPYAYVSGYENKRLVMLNLSNGVIERQFSFNWPAESITVSPDGRMMYVALLKRPHSPYWFGGHTNYIAEFDLTLRAKTKEFEVLADPGDLAVTDGGLLIMAGGSDQWTDLRSYSAATGQLLGTRNIVYNGSRISLHPSQQAVYTADNGLSPSDIQHHIFEPATGQFLSSWDSPYHGDYPMSGNVWCHPNGTNVLVRGGRVFSSSLLQNQDMRYLRALAGGFIQDAAFDTAHNALLTVGNNKLWYYDLNTGELILSRTMSNNVSYVHADNRYVYVAWISGNSTIFQRLSNPALPDPVVQEQPQNLTVVQGSPVFLSVTAGGAPPFSFQWYFQGAVFAGQTNATLFLSSAQPQHDGSYHIVITNLFGAVTSQVARVTVLVPPTITQQPTGVTVAAGGTATLSVVATGSAPLRYQWSFEGQTLPGATNAVLALNNVQASQEGVYRVTIANAIGSTNSALALVRVLPIRPSILFGPANSTVLAGSNAQFSVTAAGSAPFTYQWWFGGSILPGAAGPVLTVSNAQATHAGAYQVVVANSLGSSTSAVAMLTVLPAGPRFTIQPQDFSGAVGASVTLTALARGSDPIFYQWQFNGSNLPEAQARSLVISNATVAHSGQYALVALNLLGAVTSRVASVVITGAPPIFVQQPSSLTVGGGAGFTLNSLATGSTPLTYQWYFQGAAIPERTNSALVYSNVTSAHAGSYYVVASNAYGRRTSSVANVVVTFPPMLLASLTNRAVDVGTDVLLEVTAQGAPVLNYSWGVRGLTIAGANGPSLLLTNVQPSDAGAYRVVVGNQFGSAAATMTLTVFSQAGSLLAWGDNSGNQIQIPDALFDVVAVAGGDFHSLALQRDGTVVSWGYDVDGLATPPASLSNAVAIASGGAHALGVRLDGSVVAWGRNELGQASVPAGTTGIVAVAAGDAHSLALRQDGSILTWGDNTYGQRAVPASLGYIVAIAAGRNHSVALRNNGTVAAWGLNSAGQTQPPIGLSGVKAISAGYLHTLALRNNGTVVAWGDNTYGQASVPSGLANVIAVAAGDFHSMALCADGKVVLWGDDTFGQLDLPPLFNRAFAIGTGYYHSLAVVPPTLNYIVRPSELILWWQGGYMLQHAEAVTGPYLDLTASSPTTNSMLSGTGFFRLRTVK